MRPATPADVVAIATVHSVTTGHAYAGIFPPDAPKPTIDELSELWGERVAASLASSADPAVVVRVADNAGDERARPIVGIVACELLATSPLDGRADVTLLRSFHVLPDHWDRGLGRALHDSVLTTAAGWASTAVDVLVLEGNARGRAWYLRHRYEPTGVRLPAFGDLDLWDEGLRLAPPFHGTARS